MIFQLAIKPCIRVIDFFNPYLTMNFLKILDFFFKISLSSYIHNPFFIWQCYYKLNDIVRM